MSIPPEVQAALGGEAPVFAARGRIATLGSAFVVLYAALLFLGTALVLLALVLAGSMDWISLIFVLVFGALGTGILVKLGRPAFSSAWFVGTRSALHVVTPKESARHPWSGFVPDLVVDARPDGRGCVTLATREVLPPPPDERRSPEPVRMGLHALADAPAVGRACLRLIEGRDVPASGEAASASPARDVPARVARVLGGMASRLDFVLPHRAPWDARARRILGLLGLGGLLVVMGTFMLLNSELLGVPGSGRRTGTFLGAEYAYTLRVETSPLVAALLLVWFVIPIAAAFLVAARAAWRSWRHGGVAVGVPDALAVAEGDGVRIVSWTRVGEDVRVRDNEVHVPLRRLAEWEARRMEPETLVLADVKDPEPAVGIIQMRARERAGPTPLP